MGLSISSQVPLTTQPPFPPFIIKGFMHFPRPSFSFVSRSHFGRATATRHAAEPRKQEEDLSGNGQLRSFPRVPQLLQYSSNAKHYAGIKVKGKVIRDSPKTAVWTTGRPLLSLCGLHQLLDVQLDHLEQGLHDAWSRVLTAQQLA